MNSTARRLMQRLTDRVFGDDVLEDYVQTNEAHQAEAEQLRAQIADLQRRNREYFDVIERIEAQRDEWKRMYFDQSSKSMNAHAMLRSTITSLGTQLKNVIAALNHYLEKDGKEPITKREQLLKLGDKIVNEYKTHVEKMTEVASVDIDGKAERAKIAKGTELEKSDG